jgi:MoaA/NifB/PqqE/SkfB family radical SAM enzyme
MRTSNSEIQMPAAESLGNMCSPSGGCAPQSAIQAFVEQESARTGGLDFLWLELTPKCNLQCVHCYADSSPYLPLKGAMGYEDWKRTLEEAFTLGCRQVQFIGGEPTLYPSLLQLLSDTKEIGFESVEVYSNGTLLTREMTESFLRLGVKLAVSVYGSKANVHDEVTGRRGSFQLTIQGIRFAVESGVAVRCAVIEMPHNSYDIKATLGLLRDLGVTSVGVDRARGVGRATALLPAVHPFDELCGACWRGKLVVDSQGDVFPCVFAKSCKVGHISAGLSSILGEACLHKFREMVRDVHSAAAN